MDSKGANEPTFHLFPALPIELRAQIWRAAIETHTVRWIRTTDEGNGTSNVFTSPSRTLPLPSVCQESREIALLYGKYMLVSASPQPLWFSPSVDYLFLDPGWANLSGWQLAKDPLDSLPFDLKSVRKIMVHPNYTDNRLRPGVPLERMVGLEEILVAADEKSIGINSKFMLASVYDLKVYYEGLRRRGQVVKVPYIAVGCLGWVGEERGKLHHGEEDGRQLVSVCEGYTEMKEHLNAMREEEVRFLRERFNGRKPGLVLHFREGVNLDNLPSESSSGAPASSNGYPNVTGSNSPPTAMEEPPTYSQLISGEDV